jgi:hypothetical protein
MIRALCEVVEGWTDALPFTLKADDTAVNLSGLIVRLYLKDNRGTYIHSGTSAVALLGASGSSGVVTYTPQSTAELKAARTPYKIRFEVTDSTGGKVWFPNKDEDLIKVNVV